MQKSSSRLFFQFVKSGCGGNQVAGNITMCTQHKEQINKQANKHAQTSTQLFIRFSIAKSNYRFYQLDRQLFRLHSITKEKYDDDWTNDKNRGEKNCFGNYNVKNVYFHFQAIYILLDE